MSDTNLRNNLPQEFHKVFLLKDDKSTSYGPPATAPTRGMFLRDIQEGLQEGKAVWARHPQDFSLFEIGEFDPRSGTIHLYESKNCLGLVQDFKTN